MPDHIDIHERNIPVADLPKLMNGVDDELLKTFRKNGLLPGITDLIGFSKGLQLSIRDLIEIKTAAELYGFGLKLPIVAGLMQGIIQGQPTSCFDASIEKWINEEESPKLVLLLQNVTEWSNDWNDVDDAKVYQGARIIVPFSRYCEDVMVGLGLAERVKNYREAVIESKEQRRQLRLTSCYTCGKPLIRKQDGDRIFYQCSGCGLTIEAVPCAKCGADMLPLDAVENLIETRYECFGCGVGELYNEASIAIEINSLTLKSNAEARTENDCRTFEDIIDEH